MPAIEQSELPLVCAVASCAAGCCRGRPVVGGGLAVGLGNLEKSAQVST